MSNDFLLYDGECPACARYVEFSCLRRAHPDLRLLDARENADLVNALRRRGYEINEGIVLEIGGEVLFGAEVTNRISKICGGTGSARSVILWALGGAPWAGAIYPYLNSGRKMLLRLLGRGPIH